MGCDLILPMFSTMEPFLLTHPVWDVTIIVCNVSDMFKFLLTHPVWDVTKPLFLMLYTSLISTHTSRVGCDSNFHPLPVRPFGFLLTHPVWDVTNSIIHDSDYYVISTHTSRVGCDVHSSYISSSIVISTHTSRVGCDYDKCIYCITLDIFLLTHPVWDVTILWC